MTTRTLLSTRKLDVQLFGSGIPNRGYHQRLPHESLPAQRRSRIEVPMNITRTAAIAASMLALGTVAHADPTIDQYVTFSGFGTLGAVHSDYSQADFIGSVIQPRGAGYSRSWSP